MKKLTMRERKKEVTKAIKNLVLLQHYLDIQAPKPTGLELSNGIESAFIIKGVKMFAPSLLKKAMQELGAREEKIFILMDFFLVLFYEQGLKEEKNEKN